MNWKMIEARFQELSKPLRYIITAAIFGTLTGLFAEMPIIWPLAIGSAILAVCCLFAAVAIAME